MQSKSRKRVKSRIGDWLHNYWSYFLVMVLFPLSFGFIMVVVAFYWILVYIFANYWPIIILLWVLAIGVTIFVFLIPERKGQIRIEKIRREMNRQISIPQTPGGRNTGKGGFPISGVRRIPRHRKDEG